jgi:hypothetical protein
MKTKINQSKKRRYLVPGIALGLVLTFVFPLVLTTRGLTTRGAPPVDGKIAYATISVGQLEYTNMTPNQNSCFSCIYGVQPWAIVDIGINYPTGNNGDKVIAEVEDGGVLGNGKGVQVLALDASHNARFTFQVGDFPGLYRVIVRKGKDEKAVQLWVGASPTIARANSD